MSRKPEPEFTALEFALGIAVAVFAAALIFAGLSVFK